MSVCVDTSTCVGVHMKVGYKVLWIYSTQANVAKFFDTKVTIQVGKK